MRRFGLFSFLVVFAGTDAAADPCKAPLPMRSGERFSGVVRYVGDGDSLCVGVSRDPRTWVEVRLADFDAPELRRPGGRVAKKRLQATALGRNAACVAQRGRNGSVQVYDRVVARCQVSGRWLGDLLRARGGEEGGR